MFGAPLFTSTDDDEYDDDDDDDNDDEERRRMNAAREGRSEGSAVTRECWASGVMARYRGCGMSASQFLASSSTNHSSPVASFTKR